MKRKKYELLNKTRAGFDAEKLMEMVKSIYSFECLYEVYEARRPCDVYEGSELASTHGEMLEAAIRHNHTELIRLLLSYKPNNDKYLTDIFPNLLYYAMDARNIKLVEIFLSIDVPYGWTGKRELSISLYTGATFQSAVWCACFWDRSDVLKWLVSYYESRKRYVLIIMLLYSFYYS